MKVKLFLLIFILFPSAVLAQSGRVTGQVRHAITGFGIKDVKVTLADTLGNPIDTTRTEPALRIIRHEEWEFVEHDEKGGATFSLNTPHEGVFLLMFEKPGLESLTLTVDVRFSKRTHSYDAGTVTLFDEARQLDEAIVQGTRIKMFYRGDTLIYNAAAFATPEGSMLEDLIAQLPGAELRDGSIYVNGEKMEELLLNGKDFFQGDPQLALKNLPAYTVDKVKVFRKDGVQSRVAGRDMGDRRMVMDVRLKREYHEQWFGKAVGGLGNKHLYDGNAMLMHFDDRQSLTVYGRNNNTNRDYSLSRFGSGGIYWDTGQRKTGRYGAAFSFEPSDALRFSLKADYGHSGYATDEFTRTEYLLESGHTFSQQRRTAYSSKDEFNTSASLEMRHKRTEFRADYRFTLDKTADTSADFLANYATDPAASPLEDAWNSWQGITSRQRIRSESHTQNVRHRADVRADISFAPDVLTLKAKLDYTNRRSTSRQDYLLEYPASTRHNQTLAPSPEHKLLGELHAEFIYKYADFEGRDGQIKPFYTFGFTRSASRHPFFTHEVTDDTDDTSVITGEWPMPTPTEAFTLDEANTYYNQHHNIQHDFGLSLRHLARLPNHTWTAFNATLQFSERHASLEQQRLSETYRPERNALFFTPVIYGIWNYIPDDKEGSKGFLCLGYSISRDIPDLFLLTNSRDDRNPQFVSLGNPTLRNSLSHHIRFNAIAIKGKFTYFSNNHWHIYHNQTATARRYDRDTGVLTTQPVNIAGGQWMVQSDHTFSFSIGQASLSISPRFSHQRRADLMQTENDSPIGRKSTNHTEFGLTAHLHYYNSKTVGLSAYLRASDSRTRSSRPDHDGLHTQQIDARLNINLMCLPFGFNGWSSISLQKPFGWSSKDMNRLRVYWDASLSHSLTKRITATLEIKDLLNQGPRRTLILNDYARTEQTAATLGRNFLLSLSWDFHIQPKKRNKQSE